MVAVSRAHIEARIVEDRDEIVAFLRRDRLYAAYPLGDIDAPGRERSTFAIAYDGERRPIALAMHQEGLVPQPLFVMGDADGCSAILGDVVRPREAYFASRIEHQRALAAHYELDTPSLLLRLAVDRETFTPVDGSAERLRSRDIDALNRLYQLGFAARLPASVINDWTYYGVWDRGRLVAAAGTHAVSVAEGVAVVGNVMTHADHRGRGYAKMVTSAVTEELLRAVPDVVLNVHADNIPAVAAYTRLGYREYCRLVERLGRRRSTGLRLIKPLKEAIRLTWPRN
ncbi:MAG: GNAT family N-acetyltransferase [Chloroflexota bacterium]|nr:GNAT family N-acetyltransferase [Chloroflexota bacterium]